MKFRPYVHMTAWGSAVILTLSSLACNDEGTSPTANRPPEANGEIPAQVRVMGSSSVVDISDYFTDPDGDSLTFSATVSDSHVATISVAGSSLRITGLALGTTTVTVTATDPDGLTATQPFALTIRTQPSVDRFKLVALYEATGGAEWTTSTGWMSHTPISEWFGVETDEEGLVTELTLSLNGLEGQIPSAIAGLSHLTSLDLSWNRLQGSIPGELLRHTRLARLNLSGIDLEGPLPSGLGGLSNLTELHLAYNFRLRGPIPPELGQLTNLTVLDLTWIPLDDAIPPEFGNLNNLRVLNLKNATIKGRIPSELADLGSLEELILADNFFMFGRIPPELGNLSSLTNLDLANSGFSGPIPAEIGNLAELRILGLQGNRFTHTVPPELGRLAKLRQLYLSGTLLSGSLPPSLTALRSLEALVADRTELCAPTDTIFTRWLEGVAKRRVRSCGQTEARAYLMQAVQSRSYPVPLVAGEAALLRVFPTSDRYTEEPLPQARVTFYPGSGGEGLIVDIPVGSAAIPQQVEEGQLDLSVNAEIPGSVVQPGLELVVDLDPEETLDPTLGVVRRIPESGRLEVEVLDMPTFDVTVVPFLWQPDPDSSILDLTSGMTGDDTLFWDTRTLLPVAEMKVTVHDPVVTEHNHGLSLIRLTEMIRASEGTNGHYLGTMSGEVVGRGLAALGGRYAFSIPDAEVIAHEFGHNFNLLHAPCEVIPGFLDPAYPDFDGSIGAWGLDPRADTLVNPNTLDLMSYCDPVWVSDYHFSNAARYRVSDETSTMTSPAHQERVLFLWGGVDPEGVPHLDPAFVFDAPTSLPRSDGPHRITGRDTEGAELFSLRFEMPVVADGDGSSSFVFALPVREEWADALVSITLSGPGGSFTLDKSSDQPMAILRNPETGQIRQIVRDLPPGPAGLEAAERLGAETGFEVSFSRGIPDRADWTR